MQSITLFIRSGVIFPTFRKTICLSAVKTRKGRINESTGNEPDTKSSDFMGNANISSVGWDVIWQRIKSSPQRSANTKAGRFLLPDKSVNGNGVITISPFTNPSKTRPPLVLTNLLPIRFGLQNVSVFCHPSFRFLPQPEPLIFEPTQIAIVRCFLTYFLLSMFPSLLFFRQRYVFF